MPSSEECERMGIDCYREIEGGMIGSVVSKGFRANYWMLRAILIEIRELRKEIRKE